MDMKCRKCREPWDWWHIRDEVLKEQTLYKKMEKDGGYVVDKGKAWHPMEILREPILSTKLGIPPLTKEQMEAKSSWQFGPGPYILQCPACIGKEIELSENQRVEQDIESALADVLGNDIDGLMTEMEDLEDLMDFMRE